MTGICPILALGSSGSLQTGYLRGRFRTRVQIDQVLAHGPTNVDGTIGAGHHSLALLSHESGSLSMVESGEIPTLALSSLFDLFQDGLHRIGLLARGASRSPPGIDDVTNLRGSSQNGQRGIVYELDTLPPKAGRPAVQLSPWPLSGYAAAKARCPLLNTVDLSRGRFGTIPNDGRYPRPSPG